MGHGQVLRVSIVEGWLARQRYAAHARSDLRGHGECVFIHSGSSHPGESLPAPRGDLPGAQSSGGQSGEQPGVHRTGDEDCRRSGRDQRPGGSGPLSGTRALRLHLVMIAPGTRGLPHFHDGQETAMHVVSGETEVWHGPGLAQRSVVRAGDCIFVPPGTPHLAVNRGTVTSVVVVAGGGQAGQAAAVTLELPRHLAALRTVPVGGGE
jgi:uncharacterized RmlC-like cupin family protein